VGSCGTKPFHLDSFSTASYRKSPRTDLPVGLLCSGCECTITQLLDLGVLGFSSNLSTSVSQAVRVSPPLAWRRLVVVPGSLHVALQCRRLWTPAATPQRRLQVLHSPGRLLHSTPGAAQKEAPIANATAGRAPDGSQHSLLLADPALGSGLDRRLHALILARYGSGPDVPAPARILLNLVHYLWPVGEPVLRLRVVVSLTCLVAAKLLNIQVPFYLKHVVDSMGALTSTIARKPCTWARVQRSSILKPDAHLHWAAASLAASG
jgi:hypothetical protein